ncbi:uncharacterized protein LOC111111813 [Crassostrea virginica]|uniref:Uncharacterized protein LOC111111813 isoform X2 n=1 Tax=Crassostrea virginica TaxID=6565 RepID=A0A8B8BMW4_CRAVI|nr:uncharacterized protein LOC111111813 isoform X2 [Crassostrea virginica]
MRSLVFLISFLGFGFAAEWSGNVCYRWRTYIFSRWGCRYSTWKGCWDWEPGYIFTDQVPYCCSGWRHNGNNICSIPICPNGCGEYKGRCIKPDECQCNPGYTGKYCTTIAACSHLKPCYPGNCTSNACKCTNNFYPENNGTNNCLTFPNVTEYFPTIEQSTFELGYFQQVKYMQTYNITIDSAMSTKNLKMFWTNCRDGTFMNFTFQSIFSPSTLNLPDKPGYVSNFALGITEADISVILTDFNGIKKDSTKLHCDVNRDNPRSENLYRCAKSIDNFNTRFDSGDTLAVTYKAQTGGFRILSNNGVKQYYTGRQTSRSIELKFDTEGPYHCSQKGECSDSSTMMKIKNDVTKVPIDISWNGWKDKLSKVARYALQVFKLVKAGDGTLKEPYNDLNPNPVFVNITELNETSEGAAHSFTFQPQEPGVYSCILEVNDNANNSVYVRRFVIYDSSSTVTSDSSHPLYATSGNATSDFKWQINNPQRVSFSWENHFLNELHESGNFLARIRNVPASFYDEFRDGFKSIPDQYDDTEGKRSRDAIPNKRGIIKYDIAYALGRKQLTPKTFQYTDRTNAFIHINLSQQLQDGNSMTLWVKAYDILENTKTERIILHYDSTKPKVSSMELQTNVGLGPMNFTSSVRIMGASDPHSGVKKIKYRFKALSTGKVINNRDYEYHNPSRDQYYCNTNPCDTNLPTGESFGVTINLPFSNCYAINISNMSTETVNLEMDIFNSAGLFIRKEMQIKNLSSLTGINNYAGPHNIRIDDRFNTSYKIMWNQAPSCCNIQGFQLALSKANGQILQISTFNETQNWIILDDVEEGTTYNLVILTMYGNDRDNRIRSSVPSNFTFVAQTQSEMQSSRGSMCMLHCSKMIGILLIVFVQLIGY